MQQYTNFIRAAEVKYYRSINSSKVRNCCSFNIITGPNDVGKSNFLRALNLFFNHVSPTGEEIDFTEEFSHKRLEVVRKESVKGKQFIQVIVEFNRGPFFPNTLPPKFKVIKTWHRDSLVPTMSDDLPGQISSGKLNTTISKARTSLQKFLNRIRYTYVPAIKDQDTFSGILADLQESMFDSSEKAGSSLTSQIESFNAELRSQAAELRTDFTESTGINADISLPLSLRDLFQSFNVRTDGLGGEFVSLDQRGDGIRVRFIPAIMNYIAEHSSHHHIWGFEEPENSMEFKRAFELSEKMRSHYANNAQIFITTHSPAFIDLSKSNQAIYVARRVDDGTTFNEINAKTAAALFDGDAELGLAEELGHISLLGKLHQQLSTAIAEAHAVHETGLMIQKEMAESKRPLVLTEGKTDALLIKAAWTKLRAAALPFSIRSCDTLPDTDPNEAAGASVLAGALKTVRADSPHLTIGLFDRDAEGMKEFNLDKNFSVIDGAGEAKVHKNRRSVALVLPYPASLGHMATADNLPIEFLFAKETLDKKIDGRGLDVQYQELKTICGGKLVSTSVSDRPEHMTIKSGKVYFATSVVPTLDKDEFSGFEPLLTAIESLILNYADAA